MNMRFSRWHDWSCFCNKPAVIPNTPGVYLIGENAECNATPDPTSANVIYIGKSLDLRERLRAFDRTCKGGRGHAGGRTLRALRFNDSPPEPKWDDLKSKLSIAFCRPDHDTCPSDSEMSIRLFKEAWIHLAEAKHLFDYVLKNNRYPECNGGLTRHASR